MYPGYNPPPPYGAPQYAAPAYAPPSAPPAPGYSPYPHASGPPPASQPAADHRYPSINSGANAAPAHAAPPPASRPPPPPSGWLAASDAPVTAAPRPPPPVAHNNPYASAPPHAAPHTHNPYATPPHNPYASAPPHPPHAAAHNPYASAPPPYSSAPAHAHAPPPYGAPPAAHHHPPPHPGAPMHGSAYGAPPMPGSAYGAPPAYHPPPYHPPAYNAHPPPSYAPPAAASPYMPPPHPGMPLAAPPVPSAPPAPPVDNRPDYEIDNLVNRTHYRATYLPPPAPPGDLPKKALLVGCSYRGTKSELQGCINDVKCLKHLLLTRFGYPEASIVMLDDSQTHPDFVPTRANIIRGFHWMLMDSKPGSRLFFSFSGHGSQVKDRNGDEESGYDQTILPCDYATAGQITDDEINDRLIKLVMPGVTLNVIVDACHSGSVLDLQYTTQFKPGCKWVWKKGRALRTKCTSGGLAISFSACQDSEVAADTKMMSKTAHTGAATYAFIQAIEAGGIYQSYGKVLERMHTSLLALKMKNNQGARASTGVGDVLEKLAKYSLGDGIVSSLDNGQTPVLSCNEPLDVKSTKLMI